MFPKMARYVFVCIVILSLANIIVTADPSDPSPEEYIFIKSWGSVGTGDGQFYYPAGIAVDNFNNIYVVDERYEYERVQKFDCNGLFLTKWGSHGSGNGQFNSTLGITVDGNDYVYVTDNAGNNHIQKFDSSGNFLTFWGSEGSGDGQFNEPYDIAVDVSGNIYIADYNNHRIQKFDCNGNFLTKWGSQGVNDGQFQFPRSVSTDPQSNVYVVDCFNYRIQKFDSNGTFLLKWGSNGSNDGQFHEPTGIEVDKDGYVFVSDWDSTNSRIQKFDSNGQFITKWGSSGSGDGQFNYPWGIAIDSSGYVYVSEYNNPRVQKFGLKKQSESSQGNVSIAFSSNRGGNFNIYVMNEDGTGQTALTNNPADDTSPEWSPDGKKIAFSSNRDGNAEIYVMNADGTGQIALTNNAVVDISPMWSPDGKKIAFSSNRDGNFNVYVMNPDGTDQTALTNNPADDESPTWSPNGEKIAFTSSRNGNHQIFVMNSDGSDQKCLSNNQMQDEMPSWSPNGVKIAFTSSRNGNSQIFVMNSDGSDQKCLSNNQETDEHPAWSPDGSKIIFTSYRDYSGANNDKDEIYLMNADGSNQKDLTNNPAWDSDPSWKPVSGDFGKLEIITSPAGALVFFNNQFEGVTPLFIQSIVVGQYNLNLVLDGYKEVNQTVIITKGQTTSVSVKLEEIHPFGNLSVKTEPVGASVQVNGQIKGNTPLLVENILNGVHTLSLHLNNYKDVTQLVTIEKGQTTSINIKLEKMPGVGNLSVETKPKGADVFLDGQYLGLTPLFASNILAGAHDISVHREGYWEKHNLIRITEGKTTSIDYHLEKSRGAGKTSISTRPEEAEVYIDGQPLGLTNNVFGPLNPGTHSLLLTKRGYLDINTNVNVVADYHTEYFFKLTRTSEPLPESPAAVFIDSIPQGANIYIDKMYYGKTPLKVSNLAADEHRFDYQLEGYEPDYRITSLAAGKTTKLAVIRLKENQNPSPQPNPPAQTLIVFGISPSSGNQGDTIPVIISGSGFVSGSTSVLLQKTGSLSIPATNVQVDSSGSVVNCNFNLQESSAGSWDLYVSVSGRSPVILSRVFIVKTSTMTITRIYPESEKQGEVISINIFGTGFKKDVTFATLKKSGSLPIQPIDTNFISESQISCVFDLDKVPLGSWDVIVKGPEQTTATLPHSFTVQIPKLTIIKISPDSRPQLKKVPVTIYGTGFQSGSTEVKLQKIGSSPIYATDIQLNTQSQLACNFNLQGATIGMWDVVVTVYGEDVVTLENSFEVTKLEIPYDELVKCAETRSYCYKNLILMYAGGTGSGGAYEEYFVAVNMYNGIGDFLLDASGMSGPFEMVNEKFIDLLAVDWDYAGIIDVFYNYQLLFAAEEYTASWASKIPEEYIRVTRSQITKDREDLWNTNYMKLIDYESDYIDWQKENGYAIKDISCFYNNYDYEELNLVNWYGRGGYIQCDSTYPGLGYNKILGTGLPNELAYMDYLINKEKKAWKNRDEKMARYYLMKEKNFLQDHLNWINSLSNSFKLDSEIGVRKVQGDKYYNEYFANLIKFIEYEKELIDLIK